MSYMVCWQRGSLADDVKSDLTNDEINSSHCLHWLFSVLKAPPRAPRCNSWAHQSVQGMRRVKSDNRGCLLKIQFHYIVFENKFIFPNGYSIWDLTNMKPTCCWKACIRECLSFSFCSSCECSRRSSPLSWLLSPCRPDRDSTSLWTPACVPASLLDSPGGHYISKTINQPLHHHHQPEYWRITNTK